MTAPDLGLPTSVGSFAPEHAIAKQNARLWIEYGCCSHAISLADGYQLLTAGVTILGKANPSVRFPLMSDVKPGS